MKWWERPIAALGALSITYHEVIRGRRTGTCQECGRLNHATSELCMCGGKVIENDHPEEVLDDYEASGNGEE